MVEPIYKKYVTIYDNLTGITKYQSGVYNDCYENNNKKYDWLLIKIFLDID